MGDFEPAMAYREDRRVARKDHTCSDCGGRIAKGDTYKHVSGIWDHRPDAHKQCWPCVAFRNRLTRLNAGDPEYEGEALGGLYYHVPLADWPAHALRQRERRLAARASVSGDQ